MAAEEAAELAGPAESATPVVDDAPASRPAQRRRSALDAPREEDELRFGTFSGVFRPTFLTILGAMLYLREGWLVGNNGLLGALAVIAAALLITGTTALSIASVATNTRVRPGGAFAIISQGLGLEAGGAIGIPLFIAQTMSAAMYLYAFSEAWTRIFPTHDPQLVAMLGFAGVTVIAFLSATLASRAQAAMLVVVALALLSAIGGLFTTPLQSPTWVGRFTDVSLVQSFAIFFPAVTGIMVGVGMSGNLKDPRKSIPTGTLAAWAVTGSIYALGAVWYSLVANPYELLGNKTVMVDRSLVGPLILLGVLSSTLMAALSSLVAAPRLLQAMARHGIVPRSEWLGRVNAGGEPRNAAIATTALATVGLLSGSLDAIAPVITAFFILTYLAANLVVVLEQRLGMISFRPSFAINPLVPLVGAVACTIGLVLASPRPLLIAGVVMVVLTYAWLLRRRLDTPWETMQSGVAVTIATWAARRAAGLERSERAWRPDLLMPVDSLEHAKSLLPLVTSVALHNGSVKLLGIGRVDLSEDLAKLGADLRRGGLYSSSTAVAAPNFATGVTVSLDAMRGDLFPPNMVLLDATRHEASDLQRVCDHCRALGIGVVLYLPHPNGALGAHKTATVWLTDRDPDWALELHVTNLDLPVLLGYLLARSWQGRLSLATVLRNPAAGARARDFMQRLVDNARLPKDTVFHISEGDFLTRIHEAPPADVHLFGLPPTIDLARLRRIRDASGGACLFLMDSGHESALA